MQSVIAVSSEIRQLKFFIKCFYSLNDLLFYWGREIISQTNLLEREHFVVIFVSTNEFIFIITKKFNNQIISISPISIF